jgi:hypothetical protein
MKRSTKYVGLDVHQATTVTSVRAEDGHVIARTVLPTEAAIVEYFRRMRGTVHVTLDEGTQAQWLHGLLAPIVHRVLVCDRRGESRQGNKGDQPDADELSDLLRCGRLRAVYHGNAERATLQELARTYQNLVEDGTRVMLGPIDEKHDGRLDRRPFEKKPQKPQVDGPGSLGCRCRRLPQPVSLVHLARLSQLVVKLVLQRGIPNAARR